ncbi:MAG TPA: Flp pilus assembly protein CpaB [Anaerolineae bacterium]|nr:Flp pilus assembly protein CpaB [Anaerolineae bacterium]
MRRGRTFILLGLVLLLGALAVFLFASGQPQQASTPVATVEPTPAIQLVKIVVAAQNIPRGKLITADAVYLADWPRDSVPPGAFNNLEDVQNLIARTDILFNQPLMDVMLTNDRAQLTTFGSDAALLIPNDKRAVGLPIDQMASVGYALRPGDHVDVMVGFWLVDVDRDGQYPVVPFNRALVDELVASGMTPDQAANLVAQQASAAKPFLRLSTQLVLQDVEVLSVGEWKDATPIPPFTPGAPQLPTPTLPPQAAPNATATPTPAPPNMVLLIVSPQQALILQWLRESDAIIDLALRGTTDRAPADTTTVTLQYLFENFNVTLPPKLDFVINYLPSPNAAACPERWTKESCR